MSFHMEASKFRHVMNRIFTQIKKKLPFSVPLTNVNGQSIHRQKAMWFQ